MTNPQQPELGRSGKGATTEGSAKAHAETLPVTGGESFGPIPEDNLPGHHPEKEQDKPTGPPPVPPLAADDDGGGGAGRRAKGRGRAKAATAGRKGRKPAATGTATATLERDGDPSDASAAPAAPAAPAVGDGVKVRFPFAFDPLVAPTSALFGATPFSAWVDLDDTHLTVRFGVWSVRTPVENVVGAERTGPYSWWKIAGPARLSLADRGVTFATSTKGGVCIKFREPVAAVVPFGLLKHPSVTVTVDDPEALVAALPHNH